MRARAIKSSRNHVALWMIGYEDVPEKSGEIAICEIMGAYIKLDSSRIGLGVRRWADPALKDDFQEPFVNIDASQYHIYALEWFPTHLDFFIDNQIITTINQSPNYPMQFILSVYELPSQAEEADIPYPKEFFVDYFRAYQPDQGYQ